MAGLLDFLQAASNAVASNVSGPVDGLSWLLRKAGVPVPEAPVGGTDWMERQGLLRQVQPSAASVAGETVGLLSPTLLAAKAPQVAKGLLQAADNAAAPRTLRADKGAIVYHGSPHKFDAFDSSKIGTGEGAQAYGHGLYLAENPQVAQGYKDALSGLQALASGNKTNKGDIASRLSNMFGGMGDEWSRNGRNIDDIAKRLSKGSEAVDGAKVYEFADGSKFINNGNWWDVAGSSWTPEGNLYKVDLPDNAITRMLDWDKPLTEQSAAVQRALGIKQRNFAAEEALMAKAKQMGVSPTSLPEYKQLEDLLDSAAKYKGETGASFYSGGDQARRAEELRKLGIPGIRYLDGGSRGAGTGTSNFVIFPGEEGLLKILERNGRGL